MSSFLQIVRLAASAAALVSVLATPAHAADPAKAAFVYIGPTGDHGWTYAHDVGRKKAEEGLGGKVKTTSVTVQEGATSRVKLSLED